MSEDSAKKIMKIAPIISFESGGMSRDEIEAVFESLPLDITFADRDGIVTYFNHPGKRIFARTQTDIGKTAQQCFFQSETDPIARVEKVNAIISGLKTGKKPVEFCVKNAGRTVRINYVAAFDRAKNYAGCVEVIEAAPEK